MDDMASAKKYKFGPKTVGWRILFTHTECVALSTGGKTLNQVLSGTGVGNKAKGLILSSGVLPTLEGICSVGGHDGVRLEIAFYPPVVAPFPR
jgi:hypothetical protein